MAAERHSGPVIRIESVKNGLTTLVDGEPLLVIDPKCKMLRAGFMGKYRHRKVAAGEERYVERPDKNAWSHPHDALQYGMAELLSDAIHGIGKPAELQRHALNEYDPFSEPGSWGLQEVAISEDEPSDHVDRHGPRPADTCAPSGGTRCSRRVGRTPRRGRPACGRWIPSPAAYTRRSPGRQTTRARPCSLPLAPRDCPGRLLQTWRSPSGHVLGALPQCTRGLLWRRRFLFFGFVDALEELRNLMKLIDIADHSQTRQCFSSRPIRYICRHHAH